MTRESDEECLKLIATLRARTGTTAGIALRSELERLLDNLEARIVESEVWRTDRRDSRAEIERLNLLIEQLRFVPGVMHKAGLATMHGILDEAPEQRDGLRAENARLHEKVNEVGRQLVSYNEHVVRLTQKLVRLTGEVERLNAVCVIKDEEIASLRSELAGARQQIDVQRADEQPSITCPKCGKTSSSPSDIKARYCGACHLFHDQWVLDECAKQAKHDAEQGAIRLRDTIREEVAAEVLRQLGEASPVIRTLVDNLEHGVKKLRAALEVKEL